MAPKRKTHITLAVFSGITFLIIVFLIYPLFQEIKKESEELLLVTREQSLFAQRKEDIKRIRGILQEHKGDFEKMESLFINAEEPLSFINFLEEQALSSGVSFKISSLGLEKKETPWPSFYLKIETTGPFTNFLRFLERIESAPYLIKIVDLNISRLKEAKLMREGAEHLSLGDVQAFLVIRTFVKQ